MVMPWSLRQEECRAVCFPGPCVPTALHVAIGCVEDGGRGDRRVDDAAAGKEEGEQGHRAQTPLAGMPLRVTLRGAEISFQVESALATG